ncbi:hypothetical protein OE88DRAFT_1312588 [Heliocybe sulcata]|uniref:Nucleoporin Nup54 alpha-helical domain-containing protein n=1 Tax=Heliocybe sulcata TaxID=5364 RepID=A0A5C3NH61_9AGAM|nr:hypothetical protein OE88DRAFT_1312588 [Heliocybe sulcata]
MSLFGSSTPGGSLFGNTNTNTNTQPGQTNATGTGGGLFGNLGSAPASTSTQPSLFGNTNTSQPSTAGTGSSLFGNTNASGTTGGGGLFSGGSSTTQPLAGGSLFGNTGTSTNPQQQQPASGGLFGSTTSTQPASGGLFGNTTTQSQPTSSLFGNTNASQQQQQPGGGLFGNTNTGSTQPSTGGLFGNTSTTTQPSGGGLSGNTNTGAGAQRSGGLFGSTGTSTNTQPSTGGLFSNTSNQNPASTGAGSSLFGSTSGGGLFSSTTQNAAAPPSTSSLFGSAQQQPSGSLFQSQAGPQTQNSLFGGSTLGQSTLGQPALGSSLLGATILGPSPLGGSLLSSRPAVVTSVQPADPQSQFVALQQRIEAIVAAWNPNSPDCRFQHFFYNLVDPSQVHLYGRPANATNEALWQKAVHENPDPSCLVPALAVGFDDLQKRVEAQSQQATAHQEKIKELRTRIENLARRHELSNSSRLHRAAALQAQVTHRVLKLVQHLHLLIPTLRSSSIRPEEEALRAALEDIDSEIRRPGGLGRLKGKLNELWALIGAVNAARERDGKRTEGGVGWAVVNEDGLQQIAQILMEQQAGLEHLTRILQRDLKDLAVVQGASVKSEDETEQQTDLLLSSTSTLRASALRR